MADDFPEGLPLGWILDHKVRRDGTVEKFYHNIETGQKFKTKEEMARYANYCNKTRPRLDEFKECYMNSEGQFVDRPWETDPDHTFKDYVEGRVGKLKDKLSGSSSLATSDTKMPEKLQKKGKGKAKKK